MATAAELAVLLTMKDMVSDQLDKIGGRFGGLGKTVASIAAGAAASIAAIGVSGTKMAGDLEQAVANVSTIKPEIDTSAVFASLNEMQTRVPQSAQQLGDSLYNVFSSIETSQEGALKLVETFAKGAVGAATDASTFGTSVLGVMNAYGMSVEQAGHISDVFFNTVNKGVVTGQELASSLGPVTQSAKAAGVSLDELGGLIAGVTKEGGPAAQNINNLNNFLQKLTTKEAQQAIADLGVKTRTASGDFRPVLDVLTDLKPKLEGMTESARANALQAIFPDAQARIGAQTILSQLDMVKSAVNDNKTASGAAASAYEKMSSTFNSQSALLMNTLNSIMTMVGAEVLPAITPLVTMVAQALPGAFRDARAAIDPFVQEGKNIAAMAQNIAGEHGLGMIDAVLVTLEIRLKEVFGDTAAQAFHLAVEAAREVPDVLATVLEGFVQVGAGVSATTAFIQEHAVEIGLLGVAIAALSAQYAIAQAQTLVMTAVTKGQAVITTAVTAAQWALNAAMTANPIGIVIALIAALVAGLIYAYKENETFRNAVNGAWDAIKTGVGAGVQFVKDRIGELVSWWEAQGGTFGDAARAIGQAIVQGIGNAINAGMGWVKEQAGKLAMAALNAAKSALGISSPSKEFEEIGAYIVEGLADGIEQSASVAEDAVTVMSERVIEVMDEHAKRVAEADLSRRRKTEDEERAHGRRMADLQGQLAGADREERKRINDQIAQERTDHLRALEDLETEHGRRLEDIRNTEAEKALEQAAKANTQRLELIADFEDKLRDLQASVGRHAEDIATKAAEGVAKVLSDVTDKVSDETSKLARDSERLIEDVIRKFGAMDFDLESGNGAGREGDKLAGDISRLKTDYSTKRSREDEENTRKRIDFGTDLLRAKTPEDRRKAQAKRDDFERDLADRRTREDQDFAERLKRLAEDLNARRKLEVEDNKIRLDRMAQDAADRLGTMKRESTQRLGELENERQKGLTKLVQDVQEKAEILSRELGKTFAKSNLAAYSVSSSAAMQSLTGSLEGVRTSAGGNGGNGGGSPITVQLYGNYFGGVTNLNDAVVAAIEEGRRRGRIAV